MGLDQAALQVHEHLAHLVVVDPTVAHLVEVDLDATPAVGEAVELGQLLAGGVLESLRHVDVLAADLDVHRTSVRIGEYSPP